MQSGAEWFEATVDPNPLRKHVKTLQKNHVSMLQVQWTTQIWSNLTPFFPAIPM